MQTAIEYDDGWIFNRICMYSGRRIISTCETYYRSIQHYNKVYIFLPSTLNLILYAYWTWHFKFQSIASEWKTMKMDEKTIRYLKLIFSWERWFRNTRTFQQEIKCSDKIATRCLDTRPVIRTSMAIATERNEGRPFNANCVSFPMLKCFQTHNYTKNSFN